MFASRDFLRSALLQALASRVDDEEPVHTVVVALETAQIDSSGNPSPSATPSTGAVTP